MAYYNRRRRSGYGFRGRRRYGFRRGFRRYFTRWRTRYRTIFRNRYRTRYRTMYRARRSRAGNRRPRYSFTQWIWKLALLVLVVFGGIFVWNKYVKNKIVRV